MLREGSVASHFMLFSGVTWPKSALMMAAFCPLVSRPWSVATPKYFLPLALNLASMLPEVELGVVPLPVVVTVASVVVGPADPCWHCVKMSAYPKPEMIVEVTYLGVPLVYSHAGITRYTSGFAAISRTAALTPGRDGGICRWDGCQQQQGGILMHGEICLEYQRKSIQQL